MLVAPIAVSVRQSNMRPRPTCTLWLLFCLSMGAVLSYLLCIRVLPAQTRSRTCARASDCNVRGTKALKAAQLAAAVDYFTEELRDAEDDPTGNGVLLALNAWAQEALSLDDADPSALHNVASIDARQRSFKWPATVNGRYMMYIHCGMWNELRITDATAAGAKFSFNGVRIGTQPCDGFPAATGELEGQIVLRGKSGLYRGVEESASCKIEMQFRDGSLSVEEDGLCGMGAGVHTTGDYHRISVR